ncbi:hypothetical protein O4H61_18105 [Roseovarius aestuarii]|nr:hypothetical protein [Roseovarius aestuarii]
MSDPVTNVEIEDVLSSIRRLVSNESKGAAAPKQPDQSAGRSEPDKLVLAPSFRVDHVKDEQPAESQPTESAQAKAADSDESRIHTESGSVQGEQAESDAGDDGWHPEFRHAHDDQGEDGADDSWNAVEPAAEVAATDNSAADEARDWEDHGSDDQKTDTLTLEPDTDDGAIQDSPDEPETTAQALLKARVAELEQVVASRDDQWEPDGESDDAYSGSAVESLPWEDYSPDDETGSAEPKSAPSEVPDAMLATDDAPEDAAAAQAGTDESADDAPRSAVKPAVSIPHDDIPDNFVAEEEEPLSSTDSDTVADELLTADDDFLDEDALRDLVADIVRQELQGALGERITRNVRKLVRREIHRALASQDLE